MNLWDEAHWVRSLAVIQLMLVMTFKRHLGQTASLCDAIADQQSLVNFRLSITVAHHSPSLTIRHHFLQKYPVPNDDASNYSQCPTITCL